MKNKEMKYNVEDYVSPKNSDKIVIDSEVINNVNVYNMLDNTSFTECKIIETFPLERTTKKFVTLIPENYYKNELDEFIDTMSKKINEDRKNNKVSWIQDKINWWKWQLKFK